MTSADRQSIVRKHGYLDERDAIMILGERGVLPEDLSERLVKAKGFRNMLVHEYVAIDPALMLENMKTGIPDVRAFAVSMAQWLEGK